MNNIERIKILRRIEFIKTEIEDIKRYMENRDLQRIIERIIENIVNAIIDISKIILVYSDIPIPDTYKDIILSLKELNMVDPKEINFVESFVTELEKKI